MEERDLFATAAGLRMRVRHLAASREETPVAVLHGFTGCIESMQEVSAALAVDRPVLAVDLVGHGESEVPDDPRHYGMGACVEQLAELLEGQLPDIPVHLLGYSMGGRVALSFAVAHPERVRSLVLLGTSPGLADAAERSARARADEALARRIEEEGLDRFVDYWMGLPLFATQASLGPAVLAELRAQRMRCDPKGLAHSLRGMGTGAMPPLHDRLEELALPVCLVAGARDAKFVALAEAMRYRLPDARCVLVERVGHAAHLEDPPGFARIARAFPSEIDDSQETPS